MYQPVATPLRLQTYPANAGFFHFWIDTVRAQGHFDTLFAGVTRDFKICASLTIPFYNIVCDHQKP
jgi:hypothetical protein